jgi:tetratricopeptide (TPR) repeat protein
VPAEHRFPFASDLLSDPLLALRSDAGRVLAGTPPTALSAEESKQLQAALNDYIATQRYNGDRPESWINMGNVRLRTGDPQQAEKDYLHAQKLAPDFAGGYLNLADLYRMQGREADAAATLKAGLAHLPRDAALHHALGLSLIRSQEPEAAMQQLGRAVELAPEDTRFAYVYGVALNSTGAVEEAVEVLSQAHRQNPNDAQLMQTLALFERDRGNINQARAWAEKMLSLNPADPAARQLLQSLTPDGD